MVTRWQWLLRRLSRRLWFRATLLALLGAITPLLALLFGPLIPYEMPGEVGVTAVNRILDIMASSMLAVTTFSLATMVAAFSAATNNGTPRATELLMEEPTTQNALASFIGSFLFSLVGIITLSVGLYDQQGRIILFLVTILVIGLVVIMLLRWIDYLSRLGRVGETIDRVERSAAEAMRIWAQYPFRCGMPWNGEVPADARPLYSSRIGYVQNIDVQALNTACENGSCRVFVAALPGIFVDGTTPMAYLTGTVEEATEKAIRSAFTVGDRRSFDQDPRFGLVVLSEIASRAMSPGINDPGTAIDVIGTAVRVLSLPLEVGPLETEERRLHHVFVPTIMLSEFFDDIFTPIARDGAAVVEVGVILQKALRTLAQHDDPAYRACAEAHSAEALARAKAAFAIDADYKRVEAHALEIDQDRSARSR